MDATPALRPARLQWSEGRRRRENKHAQKLNREFAVAVKNLRFPVQEKACIVDMSNLMDRLYEDLPPRNDGAHPIAHIKRVGLKLAGKGKGRYGIRDKDIIIAGLGHDGIEDHAEALARLGNRSGENDHIEALQYMSDTFGTDSADIMAHTTRKKPKKRLPRQERIASYSEYVQGVINDPRALIVKIADVHDNTAYPSPDLTQREYSMEKYWNAIPILQEGVRRHKKYIIELGGHMLLLRLTLDLMVAKRRASVWKKLAARG